MALTTGCQHSTGVFRGARYQGKFFQVIAAVAHVGRQIVEFALMAEGVLMKGLEQDFHLFLENLPVRLLVQERAAQAFHLPGVIAAADAEGNAALRHMVGHGIVFGQAQRMPHRRDVETAADAQCLGQMRQMHAHHQDVRNAFVAFALEMMFGEPERVVAEPVHARRQGLGLGENRRQMVVAIAPFIHWRDVLTHVAQIHVAGEEG